MLFLISITLLFSRYVKFLAERGSAVKDPEAWEEMYVLAASNRASRVHSADV